MMKRALFIATAGVLAGSTSAIAQSDDAPIVYPKKTEIIMDGTSVSASVQGPAGAVVQETRRPRFNSIIKLRRDFDAELERSVEIVR
jgi:hypothetical protein